MKVYNKEKFYFLTSVLGGTKKEPKEGESYYRFETRYIKTFPYFTRKLITYKLINNNWVEQKRED